MYIDGKLQSGLGMHYCWLRINPAGNLKEDNTIDVVKVDCEAKLIRMIVIVRPTSASINSALASNHIQPTLSRMPLLLISYSIPLQLN